MKDDAISKIKKVFLRYHGPSKSALKTVENKNKWAGTNKLKLANVIKKRTIGPLISSGAYGDVYQFGTDFKYVWKLMNIRDKDDLKIFMNEIRVGTTPGIERVGPRIYGWSTPKTGTGMTGVYIMDNVLRGDTSLVSQSLEAYIGKYHPTADAPVFKMLKTTIRNFWLITKGYHGDLHGQNIAVLTKGNTPNVARVMIYDYGASKRLKGRLNRHMTFEQLANTINKNFARSVAKRPNRISMFPAHPAYRVQSKVYAPILGQARRSNSNVLRSLSVKTGGLMKNRVPSIMNMLYRPRKTTLPNYFGSPRKVVRSVRPRVPYTSPKRVQTSIKNYFKSKKHV